jgi:SAM-dependent methyltransferase
MALFKESGYYAPLVDSVHKIYSVKDKDVLEFGSGIGTCCKEFLNFGAKNVYGYEISQSSLMEAQKLYGSEQKIEFIEADFCKGGFSHPAVDIVFSHSVLQYVDNLEVTAKCSFDVLKPGGYTFATAPVTLVRTYPLILMQNINMFLLPKFVKQNLYRLVGLYVKTKSILTGAQSKKECQSFLQKDILESNAYYLNVPAIRFIYKKDLLKAYESAGFIDIKIVRAPLLHKSNPHYMVIAQKPEE